MKIFTIFILGILKLGTGESKNTTLERIRCVANQGTGLKLFNLRNKMEKKLEI
jgi:hypothetical protein